MKILAQELNGLRKELKYLESYVLVCDNSKSWALDKQQEYRRRISALTKILQQR